MTIIINNNNNINDGVIPIWFINQSGNRTHVTNHTRSMVMKLHVFRREGNHNLAHSLLHKSLHLEMDNHNVCMDHDKHNTNEDHTPGIQFLV